MTPPVTYPFVSNRKLFLSLGGFNILLGCIVLVVATGLNVNAYFRAERFATEGVETAAAIVAKNFELGPREPTGSRKREYVATMTYTTREGRDMRVEREVGRAYYQAHRVGDEVVIRYLQSDPADFEFNIGSNQRSVNIYLTFNVLLFVVLVAAILWSLRRCSSAAQARENGVIEFAEMTGLKEAAFKAGWKDGFYLTWRNEAGDEGRSIRHPKVHFEGLEVGDQITLYRGLRDVWWDGDVGTR